MKISERDFEDYKSVRDNSAQDLLAHAAKSSGRPVLQIAREARQMEKSWAQINLVEYVRMGLYDLERFTPEERDRFISNDRHWPITHACNDKNWTSAAEDKALAYTLLQAGGVPVPETVAVIDASARRYPGVPKIANVEDLRAILQENTGPLFCKIADGMISFGAFRIESADEASITCAGHAPMSYDAFLKDFVGDKPYLVQRELTNHSALGPYATALATVRMVNLVTDDGVMCPNAVIKLPQGANIADAFWRPGNLACDVDPETGVVRTVARRAIEMEFLEDHPDTAGLKGLTLPFWQELREINERAAQLFAPIRYQSTDIAITETGPVMVEINYGGGFDLPQYASGRGMMTPEVRSFFESCGVELSAKSKRRLSLFG